MKHNSQEKEFRLAEGKAIITRTDEMGRITRANPDFKETSGYDTQELIGQPHNVVRHPFMPAEIFRDLWDSIKSGKIWRGIVKNRRKNGDFYWVKATVTPIEDGYLSFRTGPKQAEVEQANRLYQALNNGAKFTMDQGRVVPTGLAGRWWRLRQRIVSLPIRTKVFWPMLFMWLVLAALLWQQGLELKHKVVEEAGKAAAISSIQNAKNARQFYSENVLPITNAAGLGISHIASMEDRNLPLPASFMRSLGEMSGASSGLLRLYSDQPFSFRTEDETRLDQFEEQAFIALKNQPDEAYFKIDQQDGQPVFRYAVADVMNQQSCVDCHNSHPDSPKTDWKLGDVRGAIEVSIPLSTVSSAIGHSFLILQLFILIVGLLSLVAVWFLAKWLSERGDRSLKVAERIAGGDLNFDTPIMDSDESGRLMNALTKMQNRLRELIYDLSYDAKHLSDAAQHLDDQSAQLTEASVLQKESTEDVAATVEQLTSAMEQISEQADVVQELAQESVDAAVESSKTVHDSANGISMMAEEISSATENLSALQNMSKEVDGIVNTIEDIAEQTNLLALNAAIEAARAGEHGRGFAVVADEVRNLSHRTAQSTSEISQVIAKIQAMVGQVSQDMDDGIKNMRQGVDLAHKAGDSVAVLEDKAKQVTMSVTQIRNFLREHEQGMTIIAQRIEQIAQSSAQVAAGNDEVTKSVDRLYQMAGDVHRYSKQFTVV